MSTEQNKALFRRLLDEVANKGNIALIDELVSPGVLEHEAFPGLSPDREGVKQFFTRIRQAFLDLRVTIHDEIAEGDKVVFRETWSGTHKGEFVGVAPTGKKVSFGTIDIVRIADGKIVEHWGQTDTMGLMQQLGVIPPPEQGGK